jgi:REP element-mobilizing transposase RayT
VNRGKIFLEEENYFFFLRKVVRLLLPILDVSAYCLMPNHYHLLVVVKEISKVDQTSEVDETSEVSLMVSRAMMKLSVSYTKAVNHRYDRVGPLFQGASLLDIFTSIRWKLGWFDYQRIGISQAVGHTRVQKSLNCCQ